MAKYRRELSKIQQKDIQTTYSKHKKDAGGIFTEPKRRKLIGLKKKSSKEFEETSDFWYDVRTTVKSGLMDLQLISQVANNDQKRAMFDLVPYVEKKDDPARASLPDIMEKILTEVKRTKLRWDSYGIPHIVESVEEDDSWKAFLARKMIFVCLKFFEDNGFVTSKSHTRLVEELKDMLNVEMGHALFLPKYKRNVIV